MAEAVRVDVRQIVPLAELLEPVRHAVWVHGFSVVLREYKALIVEVFTKSQSLG